MEGVNVQLPPLKEWKDAKKAFFNVKAEPVATTSVGTAPVLLSLGGNVVIDPILKTRGGAVCADSVGDTLETHFPKHLKETKALRLCVIGNPDARDLVLTAWKNSRKNSTKDKIVEMDSPETATAATVTETGNDLRLPIRSKEKTDMMYTAFSGPCSIRGYMWAVLTATRQLQKGGSMVVSFCDNDVYSTQPFAQLMALAAMSFDKCFLYKSPKSTSLATLTLVAVSFNNESVMKWVESELYDSVRRAKRPIVDLLPGKPFPEVFQQAYAQAVTLTRVHNAKVVFHGA